MSTSIYPVRVEAHIDSKLSRWQWLFKWLIAVPHYVVLALLWVAFVVLSLAAFLAILFTGRYPRVIFDFNVGVLRWTWRVSYYAYGALATDRYPPFSLHERPDYPAHLEVDYPAHLSRGLVLVKWWLLAIPHYLVIGLFLGTGWALSDRNPGGDRTGGPGLIGLLVLVAAVVLLFTGRYPRAVFDLVLGLNRWVLRVAAYAALMTDVYPPFRLDQGGDDPATLLTPGPATPGPATAGLTTPAAAPAGFVDPASPTPVAGTDAPTNPGRVHTWTPGRMVALVVGCVMLLGSVGLGIGGAALAVADRGLRDGEGFLMSDTTGLETSTYAIASTSIAVHADTTPALMPNELLGDVKVTANGRDTSVFVGIAATTDVETYLGGVEHATLTDLADRPVYETTAGVAPEFLPGATDIWVAQSSGTGSQEVVWPVTNGDWTLVVMNADGTRGVDVDAAVGATVPALDWLVPLLLALAAIGLVVAGVLMVVAFRSTAVVRDPLAH